MATPETQSQQPATEFPSQEVILQAVNKEDISAQLDWAELQALKDPNQRKAFIEGALDMRGRESADHLRKELKEARERHQSETSQDPETARALSEVEAAIEQHAKSEQEAAPKAEQAAAKVELFGMDLTGVWNNVKSMASTVGQWMKPLSEGFSFVIAQLRDAFAAMGPQVGSVLEQFGFRVPDFLKPEPKFLVSLRKGLEKEGVALKTDEDDDVPGKLGRVEAAYRDIVSASEQPVSMPQFLQELAVEAKALQGGSTDTSLATLDMAASRMKNKRSKSSPAAPSEQPTVAKDK